MPHTEKAGRKWRPATGLGRQQVDAVDSTDRVTRQGLIPGIDTPLFDLSSDGKWRLAADGLQWIIQRRCRRPNAKSIGFEGRAFIGGRKQSLRRVIAEKGITLSDAARADLDRLPETFAQFRATWPDRKGAGSARKHGANAIVGEGGQ